MADRKILTPDASHPITVSTSLQRVIVKAGSLQVADSRNALTLAEASYAPVQYIPRSDVDMSLLRRSHHTTWCPYKGEANYYSVPTLGELGLNSVWTYETPLDAVAGIAGLLAFYSDRVAIRLEK